MPSVFAGASFGSARIAAGRWNCASSMRPGAPDPETTEGHLQLEQASYFLSKIELQRGDQPTMAGWRKRLFIATSYITADAAEHFGLHRDRTVIMGSHIQV
ncbi:hypothetical protein [Dactylosporangium sp. NPDC049140]|uniref:KUP/HAK/KT family potassium transporter n=1 Tax=Dactylosporangium sp. NPDC049140 TaxID=3155647 RepID=UPI0033E58BE2